LVVPDKKLSEALLVSGVRFQVSDKARENHFSVGNFVCRRCEACKM